MLSSRVKPAGLLVICALAAGFLAAGTEPGEGGGATTRVSVSTAGVEGDLLSARPTMSDDGRLVAFDSDAPDLVEDDFNAVRDVFLHDRTSGETTRLSARADGTGGNGPSGHPALSGDGRHVAFASFASDLASGTAGGRRNVFVRDLGSGEIRCISRAPDGTPADGDSGEPALSGDGRYAAYASRASNLVRGDIGRASDIFLWDRATGRTTRISVAADGTQADGPSSDPAISSDGRWVAFTSDASNLVPADTNGASDVFLYAIETGALERVSVGAAGVQGDAGSRHAALSADAARVAFSSEASDLVDGDANRKMDVFVRDRRTGVTEMVSATPAGRPANGESARPAISADGRYVAFQSRASNLVQSDRNRFCASANDPPNCPDVFVRDLVEGSTRRVSVASDGTEGDNGTYARVVAISADGRVIAFSSLASNLVPGDTNDTGDVFVHVWPE